MNKKFDRIKNYFSKTNPKESVCNCLILVCKSIFVSYL